MPSAGLPQSWARKGGAARAVLALRQQLERDNTQLGSIPLWRRKFLWPQAEIQGRPRRPPYYGSFTKHRWGQVASDRGVGIS